MISRKATILLMILVVLIFMTACGLQTKEDVPEIIVDSVEDMHDEVKENIKDFVNATENSN